MIVGIESMAMYTARYYLALSDLATARNIDPLKYTVGLGQEKMGVLPPNEDVVTMAATAANEALSGIDKNDISMVLFATESGIDQSKAAGIWVHNLLGLSSSCRVIELKQACYAGCAGLLLALNHIRQNPKEKVLLLTSDVARYGLHTSGEPTQGCGACALVLSSAPKLVAIEQETASYTTHVMDFWRPNYKNEALVDGKYSTKIYLEALGACWKNYHVVSNRTLSDHARFCYHIPFTKMAMKAHERLCRESQNAGYLQNELQEALVYSKNLGNSYTASLFIGLTSLLEQSTEDLADKRIGFFSYGSGCVAEFFSGIVLPGYKAHLKKAYHHEMLETRKKLSVSDYEKLYSYRLPEDGKAFSVPYYDAGAFVLSELSEHQRKYAQTVY
jgi:hydroxymethylglutaryl-CoA synthase